MTKTKITSRNANLALLLATTALIINFWAWTLLSPLGTKYANELALQPLMLSFLLAVPVIVGSVGRILLGMLTDKFGGKIMFTVICFLTALPVFGLTVSQGYSQLLFVAFFLGLGGAVFAIGIPFISAWFAPERRGLVLGIYSMGNAGTALSAFFTPRLSSSIGTNATFIFVGVLLVTTGIIFALFGKNSPAWKSQKGSAVGRLSIAAKQRITWDLSAVYVITFGAFVAFGVYLPVLLKVAYDLSLTDAASRAAGFVLLATIARPVGGWLSDKIGAKRVIRVGLSFVVLLAAFVAFQSTLQIYTSIAYLSLAFVLGCCNGAVFALVGKLAKPESMGSMTGIVGAAGGLGGFLPPLILGLTYQKTQSYAAALVMLAVSAFIVLLYVNGRFRDKTIYNNV
jgi:NNP family nitrate/nitrite transporter-like MFS transporter